MGMVIRGEATIVGKDAYGRTIYKLEQKKKAN